MLWSVSSRTWNDRSIWGIYPLERLTRIETPPDLEDVPPPRPIGLQRPDALASIVNAIGDYQAMLDAIRGGIANPNRADLPDDPKARANHLKAFGCFSDASMVGTCSLPQDALLEKPYRNPGLDRLVGDLRTQQTKTLASGIDLIMADLKESVEAPATSIANHTHAIVFLY